MFLLRDKPITHGEKRETSTKTMLRDKLGVFVSRISPPLFGVAPVNRRRHRGLLKLPTISP